MAELILGGARSGKSRYAEQCAIGSGKDIIYIATAVAGDAEMANRIERHRQKRPATWQTVEEPIQLANTLQQYAAPERCILVDCLTLWLSNVLFDKEGRLQEALFQHERELLLEILTELPGRIVMVSNEVGMGIIPTNTLARRFIDEAGWLHQDLAKICTRVVWVVAGIPQVVKGVETV
jgi:adenosylcobinamide kinase/adenosylcobinamide-phosphate guanylyltransferase